MVFLFQQHPAAHRSTEELEFRSDFRKARTAHQTPFRCEKRLSTDNVFVIALAASFALLFGIQRQDPQVDEAVLSELRTIQINYALLQRDVARARTDMVLDFRPVDPTLQALQRNVTNLQRLAEISPDESSGAHSRLLAQLKSPSRTQRLPSRQRLRKMSFCKALSYGLLARLIALRGRRPTGLNSPI